MFRIETPAGEDPDLLFAACGRQKHGPTAPSQSLRSLSGKRITVQSKDIGPTHAGLLYEFEEGRLVRVLRGEIVVKKPSDVPAEYKAMASWPPSFVDGLRLYPFQMLSKVPPDLREKVGKLFTTEHGHSWDLIAEIVQDDRFPVNRGFISRPARAGEADLAARVAALLTDYQTDGTYKFEDLDVIEPDVYAELNDCGFLAKNQLAFVRREHQRLLAAAANAELHHRPDWSARLWECALGHGLPVLAPDHAVAELEARGMKGVLPLSLAALPGNRDGVVVVLAERCTIAALLPVFACKRVVLYGDKDQVVVNLARGPMGAFRYLCRKLPFDTAPWPEAMREQHPIYQDLGAATTVCVDFAIAPIENLSVIVPPARQASTLVLCPDDEVRKEAMRVLGLLDAPQHNRLFYVPHLDLLAKGDAIQRCGHMYKIKDRKPFLVKTIRRADVETYAAYMGFGAPHVVCLVGASTTRTQLQSMVKYLHGDSFKLVVLTPTGRKGLRDIPLI